MSDLEKGILLMKKGKIMLSLFIASLVMSACNAKQQEDVFTYGEVKNSKVAHIHGLGYINGGHDIAIATHDGLYKYGKDGWQEANGQKHDYMGFQATREGFFASGHPEEGAHLKNPFGLIKSTNQGASFEQLAFYGEIDFHYLAAGYDSNMIYVYNETATDNMEIGLHYSADEGKTWEKVAMTGYHSNTIANLAAHPLKKQVLGIGSQDGLFISDNYGENFTLMNDAKMVTSVTLNDIGGYYSNIENNHVYLTSFLFGNKSERQIPLPTGQKLQPIIYLAVNPQQDKELVIMTNNIDIYVTRDEGLSWDKLASDGELLD